MSIIVGSRLCHTALLRLAAAVLDDLQLTGNTEATSGSICLAAPMAVPPHVHGCVDGYVWLPVRHRGYVPVSINRYFVRMTLNVAAQSADR